LSELRGALATGTSDAGGSSTTMIDAARTEANDVWNGAWILFTSGAVVNQVRLITNFVAATDEITFAPPTTAAIGAGITYEILPNGAVDLQSWVGLDTSLKAPLALSGSLGGLVQIDVEEWLSSIPNTLTAGRVESLVGAMDTEVLTADALAADAIAEIGVEVNAQVLDVFNVDTFAEPGQEAPAATTTLVKKIGYLYKFLRNKITQTSTTLSVFADDASTVDQKATVSDDATTYTRGEIGTGP